MHFFKSVSKNNKNEGVNTGRVVLCKPKCIRGVAVSLHSFLTFTLDRCEWWDSSSSRYIRGEIFLITHCIRSRVGPILNALEKGKNICSCWIPNQVSLDVQPLF